MKRYETLFRWSNADHTRGLLLSFLISQPRVVFYQSLDHHFRSSGISCARKEYLCTAQSYWNAILYNGKRTEEENEKESGLCLLSTRESMHRETWIALSLGLTLPEDVHSSS